MIKATFITPPKGVKVQSTTQTKNGITIIVKPQSITVMVNSQPNVLNNFRKGCEL
jgi:hypothetical protein